MTGETPPAAAKGVTEATIADAKRMARHLHGRSSTDSATNLRTYTARMAEDDAKAAWLLNALLEALSTPAAPELAVKVKPLTKTPGADEAFAALDLADRLIERGYGDGIPKEWDKAYRAVAKARAASPQQGEKA